MTTITQSNRLYIDFAMPEDEARLVREKGAGVVLRLYTGDGAVLPRPARIDFISPRVNPDTGTIDIKAVYDNFDDAVSAGQFVRAEIEGLAAGSGIYIPERAVLHGASGPLVWALDRNNKVAMRPIELGSSNGNLIRVTKGLARGDRVVVDGILKLQPGMAVRPQPFRIEGGVRR